MWNIKYLHTIPLEEGRREGASFAFSEPRLRSFTICKQVCIVLAGTSFATTGDLSPLRSAELCEVQGEGVPTITLKFASTKK